MLKRLQMVLLSVLPLPAATAFDIENGDDLHFEHCTGCHDETVYTREKRNVGSKERLVQQVRFCKDTIGFAWFDEDVDDVAAFLDRNYYRFE